MIGDTKTDGTAKPRGLKEWQVESNVHDDHPFYGIGLALFSLMERVSKITDELKWQHEKQTEELDVQRRQFLNGLDVATSLHRNIQKDMGDSFARVGRLLHQLSEIEGQLTDITRTITGDLDYEKLAAPLAKRIAEICDEIPLDRLKLNFIELTTLEGKIQGVQARIRTVEMEIAHGKWWKAVTALGSVACAISLGFSIYIFSHVKSHVNQTATNAITPMPAIMATEHETPADKFAPVRAGHWEPKSTVFESGGRIYVELQAETSGK